MLGERFVIAVDLMVRAHAGQHRKGSDLPYSSHLLGVCAIVLQVGGDEDLAIAALLHDVLEDQPRWAAEVGQFGERVLRVVAECSDSQPGAVRSARSWRQRKDAYLQHLGQASDDGRLVSLADKLDNARAIVRDLAELGEGVWARFNAGREGQLWYYREVVRRFTEAPPRLGRVLIHELERRVTEMERVWSSEASRLPSP